jgi:hypothetical protein
MDLFLTISFFALGGYIITLTAIVALEQFNVIKKGKILFVAITVGEYLVIALAILALLNYVFWN